jgi:hypothetical protein
MSVGLCHYNGCSPITLDVQLSIFSSSVVYPNVLQGSGLTLYNLGALFHGQLRF